jgi:tRNA1Val (adenine37-N6)-methyltransferase
MLTTESLFEGRIRIRQKKKGYRFTLDAAILADHVFLRKNQTVVDLGTGCGILPIILAYRFPTVRLFGIEIQKDLAELAVTNVELNAMTDRITIVTADMRDCSIPLEPQTADVVLSNPPYCKAEAGRVSPNMERTLARHEIMASLSDVLSTARRLLKPSGRVSLIYAAGRLVDLASQMRAFGLEPKRLRMIHSTEKRQAELVYVEGAKNGNPGVTVLPPLIVHRPEGGFTEEIEKMMIHR